MRQQFPSSAPFTGKVPADRRSAGVPVQRLLVATVAALCSLAALAEAARGAPAGPVEPAEPAKTPRGIAAGEVILTEGILAFEEGRDREAEERLTEAVAADPDNGTARHWLGLVELRLGHASAAVKSLSAALAARRPPEEGTWRAAADLGAARRAAGADAKEGPPVVAPPYPGGALAVTVAPPRWEGRVSLEAGYDSNPGLLPPDVALPLSGGRLARPAADPGADLDLRFEHYPLAGREGWQLGWGVTGNRSAYRHQSDLDFGLAGPFAELAWGKDPRGYLTGPLGAMRVPAGEGRLGLLVQAAETWTWLGRADYLRLAAASAALTVRGARRTATRIDLAASQTHFAGDVTGDLRRGGAELSAGIGESLVVGHGGYLRLAAAAGRRRAGASFAHRFAEATAEAGAPLPAGWTLYLQASRRQARYDHPQSNFLQPGGPARSDATWRASAAAVRWLGPHLACTARASYIRRGSSVAPSGLAPVLDYRRTTAGLGLGWFF